MPIRRAKYPHTKVYRPDGTKYATSSDGENMPVAYGNYWVATSIVLELAVRDAMQSFVLEFGRMPDVSKLVVEITCTTNGARATVYEIPEEVK